MDCCLFVADAIEAMTGRDVAASFRGRYRNRAEAFDAVAAVTGRRTVQSIAAQLFQAHGCASCPAAAARRGDAVLLDNGLLGLLDLSGRDIVVCARRGLWRAPLTLAQKGWHV